MKRVFVIGLDCAAPELVFDRWRDDLPNLRRLMESGVYGEIESTIPAITVPAWMSMMTSKDPGQLGFYGFRNRKNYSYDDMAFATSLMVKEKTVWDILSERERRCIVVGVPPSYPPKPLNGCLIGCFLTPSIESDYTYPRSLRDEIAEHVGTYILDVPNFRTDDKENLLKQIYDLMEVRFETVRYLMGNKPWDFFMFVEMGVDRIHHGFWEFMDESHPKYVPGSPYKNAIYDYYRAVDAQIGSLLERLDDDTAVIVVSDHGAKKMDGGICFNDWLIREGYLKLKHPVQGEPVQLTSDMIDWEHTLAWGSGGYYGRLFLNVKGREPQGVVDPEDYEKVRDELIEKLEALTDEGGRDIGTRVFKPQQIYREVRNISPDLIVYFGDLDWRSVGTVGNPKIWTYENDTGPDGANHSQYGIFILYDPGSNDRGRLEGLHVMDVAPTVLELMGIEPPEDMSGRDVREGASAYTPEEEEEIDRRLEALGYL
ncbi:MAG: phosphodiesterase [Candidatus Latescibacterota bacterium]|nr:MAG: phosphodiesterase [Candidatus Latescibacterota bacterium]RKY62945.1 MAG: phosphodiesterase [Candidatus Latescibacterota bacterium]